MYKLVLREERFSYHVLTEGDALVDILQYLENYDYLCLFEYLESYKECVVNGSEDNLLEYIDDTMRENAWNYKDITPKDILERKLDALYGRFR